MEGNYIRSKYDLHIHSTWSDGLNTIEEIFRVAKKAKFNCISITDHDTNEHWEEVKSIGNARKIPYILGTEFSAIHMGKEVHILGYNYDNSPNLKINSILQEYKDANTRWVINMIINFAAKTGKFINFEKFNYGGSPDKVRLAKFLLENNELVLKDNQTFQNLVENTFKHGGKFHIKRRIKRKDVAEIINAIHDAGGMAVLAHPDKDDITEEDIRFMSQKVGLDGIEIFCQKSPKNQERYLEIANKYNLIRTGGSDFHGVGLLGSNVPEETYNKLIEKKIVILP